MSGERCQLKTIDGAPCAVHFDCDDYADGTITNISTGKVVARGNTGVVIDKAKVRDILQRLDSRQGFSDGDLGIEQATNAIGRLQRPPANLGEVALTVACPYCGRTPGNPCQRAGSDVTAHPSRLAQAINGGTQ